MKVRLLSTLFIFSLSAAEKELPKPTIVPKSVIIYPPMTPAEFSQRRNTLREVITSRTASRIIVQDVKPQDKTSE